uniref:Uncharacterized protein n=1 Tax=Arundo donax TaxID=35708 RepID=A0A0A9HAI0_ARUDO
MEISSSPECEFFMGLAVLKRCWTSHCLQRRGLQHPEFFLICLQKDETLVSCVFSWQVLQVLVVVSLGQPIIVYMIGG